MEKQLIKLSKTFGDKTLALYCDRALIKQGNKLLSVIEKKQKSENLLYKDCRIRIGWSNYIIAQKENDYIIYTPDFLKNPALDVTHDASVALMMQTQQDTFLTGLEIEGDDIAYNQSVLVLKEAFDNDTVYLQRTEPVSGEDTGWYVGILEDKKENMHADSDYTVIKAYELLYYNPFLLKILALPYGYIAIVKGEEIIEIVDQNNKKII